MPGDFKPSNDNDLKLKIEAQVQSLSNSILRVIGKYEQEVGITGSQVIASLEAVKFQIQVQQNIENLRGSLF